MKQIVMLLLACMPVMTMAQTAVENQPNEVDAHQNTVTRVAPLFGYFSMNDVINNMSDKAIVDKDLATLKEKYDEEMKNAEGEFNRRYHEFLDGQRNFAEPILRKRQSELQQMMEQNVKFKDETLKLLEQAKRDAYEPLKQKIRVAAAKLAGEVGLAFIINTDNDNLPFADPARGIDITADMKAMLK